MVTDEFAGRKITIVGAGAWGTTLADLIAEQDYTVRLWCYEPEVAEQISASRENATFLKGIKLSDNIIPTSDCEEALTGAGLVLFVVPSKFFRETARMFGPYLAKDAYVLSASKGFEVESFKRMTQVMAEEWSDRGYSAGVLSGPNLSREIATRKPAVTLVASENDELVKTFQQLLSCPHFRVYGSEDVIGTELGGALKNIYAIAAGIASGLSFGHNTLASLITRGLKEMVRLGVTLGAKEETFFGASGLGDLICTGFSELSRNQTVGRRLAGGDKLDDILSTMTHVAEGVYTTRAVHNFLKTADIEMPIAGAVYRVLFEGLDPKAGVQSLMGRSLKAE